MEEIFKIRGKNVLGHTRNEIGAYMIENKENVLFVEMFPKAKCFCPIGKAWYTNQFHISFYPYEYYIDYLDLENFIEENIEGKALTIESACSVLLSYFKKQNLNSVTVVSTVEDATHFNVRVHCK